MNKPQIFLESHNINNMYSGFGHFNFWLLKSLAEENRDFKFTVYGSRKSSFKNFEGDLEFKRYYGLHRYKNFRITKKFDLWHSLNQNSKIEPFHKVPYLLTIHDVIFLEQESFDKVDQNKVQRLKEKIDRSNALVFISKHAQQSTNHYFDIPKTILQTVIYNGNPVTAKKQIPPRNSTRGIDKPFLFSIGHFHERKNFRSLIGMLSKLKDYNLILAGNNNNEYGKIVEIEIKKHKLENRVFLLGKISETDKHYYLQNCEAFVFPSLFEGFGLPPIEAMAYGKPVFLANRTSLPEIGGGFAFYWSSFDADYMASVFENGMNNFYNNQSLYQDELKRRALSFNWNKSAKEYLEIYRTLT